MGKKKSEPIAPPKERGIFYKVLLNTLFSSVMNFTLWFALTFFVYLETKSVFAVSIIGGMYLVATASTGIWFGSLVDHHKKRTMMIIANAASLLFYIAAFIVLQTTTPDALKDSSSVALWTLATLVMLGVIAGNIRGITMPTLVTILIPEGKRDRANGLVGTVSGMSFLVTSVISGLLVAAGGMFYALLLAIFVLAATFVHLFFIRIPEKGITHIEGEPNGKKVDLRGTIKLVRGVPGLGALILFTTFNNFLGGVFMALMDAYGLSLVSVQAWGLLWGVLSTGFIFGGLIIAKTGLGKNPLRTLLLTNVTMWTISIIFPMQASIIMLAGGMLIYMYLIPFAEAAEQTILQKVVPFERQGRVFGFAQSIEQSASPLTAFIIGPLTEFYFIPLMTTGWGAQAIGSWFGTGPARGMAVVFILAAIVGLIATLLAFTTKAYRNLSARYTNGHDTPSGPTMEQATNEGLAG